MVFLGFLGASATTPVSRRRSPHPRSSCHVDRALQRSSIGRVSKCPRTLVYHSWWEFTGCIDMCVCIYVYIYTHIHIYLCVLYSLFEYQIMGSWQNGIPFTSEVIHQYNHIHRSYQILPWKPMVIGLSLSRGWNHITFSDHSWDVWWWDRWDFSEMTQSIVVNCSLMGPMLLLLFQGHYIQKPIRLCQNNRGCMPQF